MEVVFWSGTSEGLHLAIQCLLRNLALLGKNSEDKKPYIYIYKEFPCLEALKKQKISSEVTQKKCLFNTCRLLPSKWSFKFLWKLWQVKECYCEWFPFYQL